MQPLTSALLFGLAIHGGDVVHSFSPVLSSRAVSVCKTQQQPSHLRLSMPDDPYPSDYDADDLESTEKSVAVDTNEEDSVLRDELKRELILLSSVTNRGMCASTEEENLVTELITELEALNPTSDPAYV